MLSLSLKTEKGTDLRGLLTPGRCDEIKKEVLFMFEECEINTYPIDCFTIADRLYYQLRPYSSLPMVKRLKALAFDMDGYSRVEVNPKTGMNEYVIYYNDHTNQGRMRWTILHEIGHVYLGHHDNPDDSLSAFEEAEANFFAKYSIAPPPLINVAKCTSPDDVATTFDVSGEASFNIFDYYKKWMEFGPIDYELFEIEMLPKRKGGSLCRQRK